MSTKTGIIVGVSALLVVSLAVYFHKKSVEKKAAAALAQANATRKAASNINLAAQTGAFNAMI